jgi:TonB family protein
MAVPPEPIFPGGYQELLNFIEQNIQYPDTAQTLGISGTVYVSFVIEKDGEVTNEVIVRGIHNSIYEEALRVVRLMPNWIPAIQNKDEATRVKFTLPIIFKLY